MVLTDLNESPSRYDSSISMAQNAMYQSASALQIRLNTDPVVRQIESYLRGRMEQVVQDDKGVISTKTTYLGKPLVSNEGLQWLMSFVETLFNVQVVQGNFEDYDQYARFLERTRKDLAEHLMINLFSYEISEEKYGGIISNLMRFIEAFMSRLISNKERDSYANTIRSIESSSLKPMKSGFSLPFTKN